MKVGCRTDDTATAENVVADPNAPCTWEIQILRMPIYSFRRGLPGATVNAFRPSVAKLRGVDGDVNLVARKNS
jgi:hypothetical protein